MTPTTSTTPTPTTNGHAKFEDKAAEVQAEAEAEVKALNVAKTKVQAVDDKMIVQAATRIGAVEETARKARGQDEARIRRAVDKAMSKAIWSALNPAK